MRSSSNNIINNSNNIGIKVADFNKDSNLDVVVAAFGSNGIAVLLGGGDGTFGAAGVFAGKANTIYCDIGDIDGDGNMDVGNQLFVFFFFVSHLLKFFP